jgi:Tripartite tricarboxylate transporter family receptor
VPYKGAGPALADVVAGHADFTVATMPGAIQLVRSSGLRALEHFSIRLGVSRVREISVAFFFGNTFEK